MTFVLFVGFAVCGPGLKSCSPTVSILKALPPRIVPSTLLKAYGSPDGATSPTKKRSTHEVSVRFVMETCM